MYGSMQNQIWQPEFQDHLQELYLSMAWGFENSYSHCEMFAFYHLFSHCLHKLQWGCQYWKYSNYELFALQLLSSQDLQGCFACWILQPQMLYFSYSIIWGFFHWLLLQKPTWTIEIFIFRMFTTFESWQLKLVSIQWICLLDIS